MKLITPLSTLHSQHFMLLKQMSEQEIVDLREQVHPAFAVAELLVAAVNAVVLVGVNHQVELHVVGNHRLNQLHRVLVMYVVVAAAVAEQVVALDQRGVAHRRVVVVARRVLLRRAHVTLGIYVVVESPVRHRRDGDRGADDVGTLGDAVGSHEAAVAPAVNGDLVGVDVWLLRHVFRQRYHVFGLVFPELKVGHLLELLALRPAASVVDRHRDDSALREKLHPVPVAVIPLVHDGLMTRAAIDVNQDRIFLVGVEIRREDLPAVDFNGASVGHREGRVADLDELFLADIVCVKSFQKFVVVFKDPHQLSFICIKFIKIRLRRRRVNVDKIFEGIVETGVVCPHLINNSPHRAFHVHGVDLTLDRGVLRRLEINLLAVEAVDPCDVPVAGSEGLAFGAVEPAQINVVVTRPLACHEERLPVVEESPVVGDVDIIRVCLIIEDMRLTCRRVGGEDFEMVLMAVKSLDCKDVFVLRPFHSRKIDVGLLPCVHLCRLSAFEVIDIDFDDGVVFAGLRVFETVPVGVSRFEADELLHLELFHLRLVEFVEGDFLAIGRPEITEREAELLFIDPVGGTINNMVVEAVVGELRLVSRSEVLNKQVVVAHESDFRCVGRERGEALAAVFRERGQCL